MTTILSFVDPDSSKVFLQDSPCSQALLSHDFRDELLGQITQRIGSSTYSIKKKAKVEPRTWQRFLSGRPVEVASLEKLVSAAGMRWSDAEAAVLQIDRIIDLHLPLDFHCFEGARFDAAIFNEGRIRSRGLEYTNKSRQLLERVKACFRKIVGTYSFGEWTDPRMDAITISFPSLVAKRYLKLGIVPGLAKAHQDVGVPENIIRDVELSRAWFQGTLSEEACFFPFITERSNTFYVYPRIQINRNSFLPGAYPGIIKGKYYYQNEGKLSSFENYCRLSSNEAVMLSRLGVRASLGCRRVYRASDGFVTGTFSVTIIGAQVEVWADSIGFEFSWQKKLYDFLFENWGRLSKSAVGDFVFDFYSFLPKDSIGKRRIANSRHLSAEQKSELLGYASPTNSLCDGSCGSWQDVPT